MAGLRSNRRTMSLMNKGHKVTPIRSSRRWFMKGMLSEEREWGTQIRAGEETKQRFDLRRWLTSVWTHGALWNMNWGKGPVLWTSCQSARGCGLWGQNFELRWLSGNIAEQRAEMSQHSTWEVGEQAQWRASGGGPVVSFLSSDGEFREAVYTAAQGRAPSNKQSFLFHNSQLHATSL